MADRRRRRRLARVCRPLDRIRKPLQMLEPIDLRRRPPTAHMLQLGNSPAHRRIVSGLGRVRQLDQRRLVTGDGASDDTVGRLRFGRRLKPIRHLFRCRATPRRDTAAGIEHRLAAPLGLPEPAKQRPAAGIERKARDEGAGDVSRRLA